MSARAEPTGFLYPFIEAEERDAGRPPRRLWPARPRTRSTRAERLRAASIETGGGRPGARRRGHGGAVLPRRPALRLRQRWERHRRRRDGAAVPPSAARACAPRPVPGGRPGRLDGAGQRRRLRARLLPADHRPRPARRHRRRVLHQRRFGQHAPRLRGGGAAGPSHRRPVRVRTGRHGGGATPSITAWSSRRRASIGSKRPRTRSMLELWSIVQQYLWRGSADMTDTAQDDGARPGGTRLRAYRGIPPSPAPPAR